MSQSIWAYTGTNTTFGELAAKLNLNVETLRTAFSGTAFPADPEIGQPCWRTDRGTLLGAVKSGKLYRYMGDISKSENGWITEEEASDLASELVNSRGSKDTR